jgi:glutamyl-tRNA reductase
MISFGVIGASIRSGNVDLLSALTVPEDNRSRVLARLKDACGFDEMVAIFTCNRVEFYYVSDDNQTGTESRNKLLDFFLRDRDQVAFEPSDIYVRTTFRALQHLYRVAASLDSMVVGEAQILGQIKQAYAEARTLDIAGSQLTAIFTEAFRVAKKIRRETPLGKKSVSMVSLVMDAVTAHLEKWGRSTVAIIGVGPMSEKLAEHLHHRDDVDLLIVNRTVAKAEELAGKHNCRAMALDTFNTDPVPVDIVFTSTGASEPVFTQRSLERLQEVRPAGVPLLVIDLAIPRDVDPAAARVENVVIHDVPYFRSFADRNRRARFVAVDQAERIVDAEIGRAHRQNAERQFRPVFSSALNEGLAYAHAGLNRLFDGKLSHLQKADRELLTHFTEKLVRYTNHLPVGPLAEQADLSHGNCAMIAGFGCVRTRSVQVVDCDDPAANRCAKTEGKACILEQNNAFHC